VSLYGDDDGPAVDVYDTTTRKARKPHKCHACGETVRPGDTYTRVFVVWDGSTDVTKRCARCQAIYVHLAARIRRESYDGEYEQCADALNCGHEYKERWGEPPPEVIAALAFWLPGDPIPNEAKEVE
jgi:hypothetical protein